MQQRDGCTAPAVCLAAGMQLWSTAAPVLPGTGELCQQGPGPGRAHGGVLCFLRQNLLNSQPCSWLSAVFLRRTSTRGQCHKWQSRSGYLWSTRENSSPRGSRAGLLLRGPLAEQEGWDGTTDTPQEQRSFLRGCGLTLSWNGQSIPGMFKPRVWQ